jgi:hypothetical protein
MRAASAAQAVGDLAAYNYFAAALPRGGTSRKVLKAAAQRPRPPSAATQITTWSRLLGEALDAGDDQQAVTCVTALARLGRWPAQADAITGRTLPPTPPPPSAPWPGPAPVISWPSATCRTWPPGTSSPRSS